MKEKSCQVCEHKSVCKYYTEIKENTNLLLLSLSKENTNNVLFKKLDQTNYFMFKNKVEEAMTRLIAPHCEKYKEE